MCYFRRTHQVVDANRGKSRTSWTLLCKTICPRAWGSLVGLGAYRFDRFLEHARLGHIQAPVDRRFAPRTIDMESPALTRADTMLSWVWNNVAEDFAEIPAGDDIKQESLVDSTFSVG